MAVYEYRIVRIEPGPLRGRDVAGQLAQHLEDEINAQAEQGWEFVRVDRISETVKRFFRSGTVVEITVIVLRREIGAEVAAESGALVLTEMQAAASEIANSDDNPPTIERAMQGLRGARVEPPLTGARSDAKRPTLVPSGPRLRA